MDPQLRHTLIAAWLFAAISLVLWAPELAVAAADRPWMPAMITDFTRTLAETTAPVAAARARARVALDPIRKSPPLFAEAPSVDVAPTEPTATTAQPTSATAGAASPDAATTAAAHPEVRRILLIGASSIQGWFGIQLEDRLRRAGAKVRRQGKVGTGLVRPDWFDWVPETKRLRDEFHPDLIIAQFGGNDCVTADLDGRPAYFGNANWEPAFRKRFDAFLDAIGDTPLLIVGMQHPQHADLGRRLRKYNAAMERAANDSGHPYLSAWAFTEGPDHEPQQTVTWRGRTELQFESDGIHLSKLGGDHLAAWLVDELNTRYTLGDPEAATTPAEPAPR
jgi:hypothetical protein